MLLPSCLNVDLQMPLPNSIIIEEEGVAKELCLSPSEICPEKVSKDTRQSIQGYFFRVVWSSLFQISLDTFPIRKLNQWTVLWKSY